MIKIQLQIDQMYTIFHEYSHNIELANIPSQALIIVRVDDCKGYKSMLHLGEGGQILTRASVW
jgi:hypothetical protein